MLLITFRNFAIVICVLIVINHAAALAPCIDVLTRRCPCANQHNNYRSLPKILQQSRHDHH